MSKDQGGLVLSIREGDSLIISDKYGKEIEIKLCACSTGAARGRASLRIVAPREYSISRKKSP